MVRQIEELRDAVRARAAHDFGPWISRRTNVSKIPTPVFVSG